MPPSRARMSLILARGSEASTVTREGGAIADVARQEVHVGQVLTGDEHVDSSE